MTITIKTKHQKNVKVRYTDEINLKEGVEANAEKYIKFNMGIKD